MEGGGFFLIGGYLNCHAICLWDFQHEYTLSSAITWWVGDVAIHHPYDGALCHFKKVLPVLCLGLLYSFAVFIADVPVGIVHRVVSKCPVPVGFIVC